METDLNKTPGVIHCVDFEGSLSSGVLEYGIVSLRGGNIIFTETDFCSSIGKINEFERAQHGLYEEKLANKKPFFEKWSLFNKLRQTGPFCAHHAPVENSFLKATWPYPKASPLFLEGEKEGYEWGPWIDTCQLYKVLFSRLKSYKLMELIALFKLEGRLEDLSEAICPKERKKPHCALYDALASALLLMHIFEMPDFKGKSIEWLLQKSIRNSLQKMLSNQQTFLFFE